MSVTITDGMSRLRYLIARVDAFRSWVGATSGDEETKLAAALAHVHLIREGSSALVFPFCTVSWGKFSGERIASGGNAFTFRQSVNVEFVKPYTGGTEAAVKTELLTFSAETVAIVMGMKTLSGSGTYIEFSSFERKDQPSATPLSEKERWLFDKWEFAGEFWGSQTE